MSKQQQLALVCGGQSAEHEVSLVSAHFVYRSVDRATYHLEVFYLDKQGRWFWVFDPDAFFSEKTLENKLSSGKGRQVAWVFGVQSYLQTLNDNPMPFTPDVVFPCSHGPYGEDGTLQGLLAMANVACVGSGVLSSAVNMDKDVCKQLLRQADLPVAPWVCVRSGEKHPNYAQLSSQLGKRLFVKAANMGSSVAIYYVNDQASFDDAMGRVFHYDDKALIEQAVDMVREVECAVLIGKVATASMAGEVIVKDGFYDYDAKYIHTERTQFNVPADLPADMHDRISALAIKAVLATECRGMARVDCFLTGDDQVIIGEINTIPGFTAISLYPQLWQLMGKPPALLMHELIAEAISRHQHKQSLQREPEVQAALNC